MFEDKLTNQPNRVPTNLPIPPQPASARSSMTEPEDILDTIDEAPSDVAGPSRPSIQPGMPLPPAIEPPEKAVSKEPLFKQYRAAVLAVVIILSLGVIAAAGWYGYTALVAPRLQSKTPSPSTNINQPVRNTNPTNQPAAVNRNINETIPPPQPVDTDRDGLNDEEENLYGTNIERVDTDLDGLTDRDEVKVFKTDPNNPDSDGDSYLDGNEVRAGYDPRGSGRLLEIQQ